MTDIPRFAAARAARAVGAVAAIIAAAVVLASCGDDPAPTPAPAPTAVSRADVSAPIATIAPAPTSTAAPAPTATPSPTPAPTSTAAPTPAPTATPIPAPTHTPTAVPSATRTPFPTVTPTRTPAPAHTPSAVPTVAPSPTPAPTATPSPTPSPTPILPPAHALLSRSIEAMSAVDSHRYSMNIDVTTASDDVITNMPISADGVYRAPASYSAVLELDLGLFGKIAIPVIAINGAVYIQDPNFGEWEAVAQNENLSYFDPDFIAFLANPARVIPPDGVGRLRNLRLGDARTVDGVESQAVLFNLPRAEWGEENPYAKFGEVDATIWIGAEDSLMRRVEAFGNLARRDSLSQLQDGGGLGRIEPRVSFHSIATLSDFGAVNAPIERPVLGAVGGVQTVPPALSGSPTPPPKNIGPILD